MKRIFLALASFLIVLGALSHPLAAEKLQFGTVIRVYPPYTLPLLAAEDKGFWKQNGLEVEWVPFRGSVDTIRALAASSINIVAGSAFGMMQAAERGIPVIAIAGLDKRDRYFIWVSDRSRLKEPKDLRGAIMGVVRMGDLDQIYSLVALRGLGLDKDVKFIGVG